MALIVVILAGAFTFIALLSLAVILRVRRGRLPRGVLLVAFGALLACFFASFQVGKKAVRRARVALTPRPADFRRDIVECSGVVLGAEARLLGSREQEYGFPPLASYRFRIALKEFDSGGFRQGSRERFLELSIGDRNLDSTLSADARFFERDWGRGDPPDYLVTAAWSESAKELVLECHQTWN